MRWLDDLMRDARLALRMLARAPTFTAASVTTLALGIGLSVAMFTVSDAVLRRPLPAQDQDRVVVLWVRPKAASAVCRSRTSISSASAKARGRWRR